MALSFSFLSFLNSENITIIGIRFLMREQSFDSYFFKKLISFIKFVDNWHVW